MKTGRRFDVEESIDVTIECSVKSRSVEDGGPLQVRLRYLEDVEEIRQLKARFAHYGDQGFNGAGNRMADIADLFVEDGIWNHYQGREVIREFLAATQALLSLAIHLLSNPAIEVNGDTAKGRWHALIALRSHVGGEASWVCGYYSDEFVRTKEGWRLRRLTAPDVLNAFHAPYLKGWGEPVPAS